MLKLAKKGAEHNNFLKASHDTTYLALTQASGIVRMKLLHTTKHKLKSEWGAVIIVFSCQVIPKSPSTKNILSDKDFFFLDFPLV